MHNFKMNFGRFYRICKQLFESEAGSSGNFQHYFRGLALSDVQNVALSCTVGASPEKVKAKKWQMVETFFAQMTDQFNVKRNYIKRYDG